MRELERLLERLARRTNLLEQCVEELLAADFARHVAGVRTRPSPPPPPDPRRRERPVDRTASPSRGSYDWREMAVAQRPEFPKHATPTLLVGGENPNTVARNFLKANPGSEWVTLSFIGVNPYQVRIGGKYEIHNEGRPIKVWVRGDSRRAGMAAKDSEVQDTSGSRSTGGEKAAQGVSGRLKWCGSPEKP